MPVPKHGRGNRTVNYFHRRMRDQANAAYVHDGHYPAILAAVLSSIEHLMEAEQVEALIGAGAAIQRLYVEMICLRAGPPPRLDDPAEVKPAVRRTPAPKQARRRTPDPRPTGSPSSVLPPTHDVRTRPLGGERGSLEVDTLCSPGATTPDLARALEYAEPNPVGRIYARNADEFTPAMTAVVRQAHGQIDRVTDVRCHTAKMAV